MAEVVSLHPAPQTDWMAHAACKGQTHLFFPPHGEREEARLIREAKAAAVCRICPVVLECRDYARTNREQGWWGGENDDSRAAARRRALRAPQRVAVAAEA